MPFAVLPSARQAISKALEHFSLGRTSRIAVPEFSSHCLLSSVATLATPIPMREVVEHSIIPDCTLIYEQWGWPVDTDTLNACLNNDGKLILDCVDSPDAYERHANLLNHPDVIVIVSLSKCLGLAGGGLTSRGTTTASNASHTNRDQTLLELGSSFYKTYGETLGPIATWLDNNSISKALSDEADARRKNLTLIANSSLSAAWPKWMKAAVRSGCAAGIAPLFNGMPIERLQQISQDLQTDHQIAAPVYNFNWNGKSLSPIYSPCLAFPCHGEVAMEKFLAPLEQYGQTQ